jgi:hypothetical protein
VGVETLLLRLLLIAFAFYLVIRLIGIVIRSVKAYKYGSISRKKRRGEVGEGWIVDDEKDKPEE